jgi:membrane protein required for beta-lactamase induction
MESFALIAATRHWLAVLEVLLLILAGPVAAVTIAMLPALPGALGA